ncbi:MAG TPA: pitrilysin family protein [Candidatus Paceibacterota bacterium]|jgi:predicted Zn-dependent peptidase|nr:pitrilysin family protein [Candidatus Paceibacterota bacterium]HPI24438.1 pitrilysin family protein [Candidatus Paceibacterota bacterium]HPN89528.1 pitrilysin family protein [Candidatus Paceibacterota bacterium]HPV33284.1 pitrilysin family protein [Candidatus Paceibacterota bacterium]
MTPKKTILTNGIRVILLPRPDALSVSFLILTNAGAKNELDQEAGLAHFIEHMGFKGTPKRPNAKIIASEFDSLGATYNAFTGYDFTSYYVTAVPDKTVQVIDLLADIYLNPIYDEAEMEKEKGVVMEEFKSYEDKPASFVWDVFLGATYGDTPQGRTTLGKKETVAGFKRSDLMNFRRRHYLTDSTVLVVSGRFEEEKVKAQLEKLFVPLPSGRDVRPLFKEPAQSQPKVAIATRPIEQSHIVMGFRGFDIYDPRYFRLSVLSNILGGSTSSRLWQRVREELGAAYYVGTSGSNRTNFGYFALYAGTDSRKDKQIVGVMAEECRRLKNSLVTDEELIRAKNHLIGNLYLGLETSFDLGYFFGGQEIYRREILSPGEFAAKINAVSADDVRSLAQDLFKPTSLNLAAVGPNQSKDDYLRELVI